MQAYLVRVNNDAPHQRELVGVFVCVLGDLSELVDECVDPAACEYAAIGLGGIFWTARLPNVPFPDDGGASHEAMAKHAPSWCDNWADRLNDETLAWHRCTPISLFSSPAIDPKG